MKNWFSDSCNFCTKNLKKAEYVGFFSVVRIYIYISIKKQGKPDKKPGSIKAKKKCFIEGSRII